MLHAAICTNCGGSLEVEIEKDAAICDYCNTPFIIEKAIQKFNIQQNINNVISGSVVNIIGGQTDEISENMKDAEFEYYHGNKEKALLIVLDLEMKYIRDIRPCLFQMKHLLFSVEENEKIFMSQSISSKEDEFVRIRKLPFYNLESSLKKIHENAKKYRDYALIKFKYIYENDITSANQVKTNKVGGVPGYIKIPLLKLFDINEYRNDNKITPPSYTDFYKLVNKVESLLSLEIENISEDEIKEFQGYVTHYKTFSDEYIKNRQLSNELINRLNELNDMYSELNNRLSELTNIYCELEKCSLHNAKREYCYKTFDSFNRKRENTGDMIALVALLLNEGPSIGFNPTSKTVKLGGEKLANKWKKSWLQGYPRFVWTEDSGYISQERKKAKKLFKEFENGYKEVDIRYKEIKSELDL